MVWVERCGSYGSEVRWIWGLRLAGPAPDTTIQLYESPPPIIHTSIEALACNQSQTPFQGYLIYLGGSEPEITHKRVSNWIKTSIMCIQQMLKYLRSIVERIDRCNYYLWIFQIFHFWLCNIASIVIFLHVCIRVLKIRFPSLYYSNFNWYLV